MMNFIWFKTSGRAMAFKFMPDQILSHFTLRPRMSNKVRLSISTFLSSLAAGDSLVNKEKKS